MITIRTTVDTTGRKLYWLRGAKNGPLVKVSRWWAELILRKRLAKME